MNDMRAYIVNRYRYDDRDFNDKPVGDWFSFPVEMDRIRERIGNSSGDDRFEITEIDFPFEITLNESIEELNRLSIMALKLGYPLNEVIDELNFCYHSIKEVYENKDSIKWFKGCESMESVAGHLLRNGYFGDVNSVIVDCVDCKKLGEVLYNHSFAEGHVYIKTHLGYFDCPDV